MNKEILRQIVYNQKDNLNLNEFTIRREIIDNLQFSDDRIIIISGMRRVGKSTLLKQIMKDKKDWCYFNFEDERLINFNINDMEILLEVLSEVYSNSETYFFDEIQNVDKFELFLRRLHDEKKKIIITGSNATLLSRELGTKLTGRYKLIELYPFSFREFIRFKNFKFNEKELYNKDIKVKLISYFKEYMDIGGLPTYIKYLDESYVKTIFENILYRDIITRYSLKKDIYIKDLTKILASNISNKITYNSLKNILHLTNSITIKEYLKYLENSYLFFELLKFEYSTKKQLNAEKKIYLIDWIFSKTIGTKFSQDYGKILENIVFIELKRKNYEISYYNNKQECDFVLKHNNKIVDAVQVCYNIDENNRNREISGLIECMNELNLKRGKIITFDQKETFKLDDKVIDIIPIYEWLLL